MNTKGFLCIEKIPSASGIVIFGASGDLTARKLIPALFNLYSKKLLPENFFILGVSRAELSEKDIREKFKKQLRESPERDPFLERIFYMQGYYNESPTYEKLKHRLYKLNEAYNTDKNTLFYLATPPSVFEEAVKGISEAGIGEENNIKVIFEKPFCWDLKSAEKLNNILSLYLSESQIYRIDHYLGKDTVQNILLFRFANTIFEPVWNNHFIDNIQINVSETLGVEQRAGYFEKSGLLRDMFQNHIFQILALVAMEAPASFDPDRVRDEKVKLIRSIRDFGKNTKGSRIIRGQYTKGELKGDQLPAYTEEPGVDKNSTTETFVAMKLHIDNWRWEGVPFYLRAGKRMPVKSTTIAVTFKPVPHSIFPGLAPMDLASNVLVFSIQPHEGISLTIQAKKPGPKLCMTPLNMKFSYEQVFGETPPDAYERLLLDALLGDQTLFIRSDAMILAWERLAPVLDRWYGKDTPENEEIEKYPAGSWGPLSSKKLLTDDGKEWIYPCHIRNINEPGCCS